MNTLDPGRGDVRIEPRIMAVLVKLARNSGRTVLREELLDAGWSDAPYVSDESLTKAVSDLRKSLVEADPNADYIRTVPKKGYALTVPVRECPELPAATSPGSDGANSTTPAVGIHVDGAMRLTVPSSASRPERGPEGDVPAEILRLKQSVRRMKFAAMAVIAAILIGGTAWIMNPQEYRVRVRKVAVPASEVLSDLPMSAVLADTTFMIDPDVGGWLHSRLAEFDADGPDVRFRFATEDDQAESR